MIFDYFLLLLVFISPTFYTYSFWFYTIQLKEYRWDRFKEYIFTPQGKSALFNFWFFIELPLLLLSLFTYFDKNLEYIIFPVIFYFLVIFNIFVLGKIFRGRILKPKLTGRLLITVLLFIIGGLIDLYSILFLGYWNSIYFYIIVNLIFAPVIIFFYILLSLPLINYKKNKQINSAIKKSNQINNVIKIGITGSYGKSSVKEFLSSILQQDGETLKTPENRNTEMSVSALVLNKLNNKFKYFVAEMGAYRIGEISILGKIDNHKYGFLTAIGNQHIGLFGSQENIKIGKSEISESVLKNNGKLYLNWDNENIRNTKFNKKLNLVKYGINSENNLDAKSEIISLDNNKTKFILNYKNIKSEFEIDLIGKHNIINLTGVIACCIDLGLEIEDIKKYLKNLKTPDSSKNIIEINYNLSHNTKGSSIKLILIDDTYNLSEAGLSSGLDLLKSYFKQGALASCKILVLDDILELGKDSEIIHKNIGKKIAEEKLVDKIIFCGANYKKFFVEGLIEGGFNEKNIILNLDNISEKSIILFEGKKAKRYLEKIIKNK